MTPDAALPPVTDPWRQRGRLPLMIGTVLLGVAAVGLVVFFGFRAESARAVGVGLALGLVPLPLLGLFYWWIDRYEPEPRRYVLAAFLWGTAGAVGIALVGNTFLSESLDLTDAQTATFVAPLVEETAKGLFLVATFLRARRVIGGVLDGLFYAGLVGLGFAFIENIIYYSASYLGGPELGVSGAQGATATFVIRGVVSPFAHPLFTASLGLALGAAVLTRSWWARVPLVLGGWAGSMVLHGLWNGSISYAGIAGFALLYLVLVLVFFGFVALVIVLRQRQFVVLRRSLSYVADRGWIHPAELPWLTWFGYRAQARRHAKVQGGSEAAAAVRRYQSLATQLAFVHDAVMLGRPGRRGVERTLAIRAQMDELRPQLRLPPALAPLPRPVTPAPPRYAVPPVPWS
ncbi:PrsW family intramembrane metalloprotease [Aeromicrobium sp. Sec7.5]|uniref:PrsW family intramembrane metalloprotease n=1 Tax=Aeromicrobium sp. Sec7.5 TaxID=3121276 RepID=UPI002FE48E8D